MGKVKRIAISGVFAERPITGVTRYCWEIIKELDKQLPADLEVDFVVPIGVKVPYVFSNIHVVEYGKNIHFLWINYYFVKYLKKTDAVGLNLGVNIPWFRPDIAMIYDVNSIVNKAFFSRYHVVRTMIEKYIASKRAICILTISEFSKREISRTLNLNKKPIYVIPCAWTHETSIKEDASILDEWNLKKKSYYFSLSSLAPTKNFRWVEESAMRNPKYQYVIAGSANPKSFGSEALHCTCDNIVYVGGVTDEHAKALMINCRAFLFPSFYEGFGMPPLEALACGSPVVVADIPVMHEVFGDLATYIDPYDYESSGNFIVNQFDASSIGSVLDRYSWKKSASLLLNVLEEMK